MSLPQCQRCHLPITSELLVQQPAGTFHSTCFVCTQCKKPISEVPQHLTVGTIGELDWSKVLCLACHQNSIPVPPPKRANRSVSPAPRLPHSVSMVNEPTRRRSLSTGASAKEQQLFGKHSSSTGNLPLSESAIHVEPVTRGISLSISSSSIGPRRPPPKAPPPLDPAASSGGFNGLSSLLGWKQASKKPKPTASPTNKPVPPPPPPISESKNPNNITTAFSPPPEGSVLPLLYLELAEKQAALNRLNYLEDRCPWLITGKDIDRISSLKAEIKELNDSVRPVRAMAPPPSPLSGRLSVLKIISNFEPQTPSDVPMKRHQTRASISLQKDADGRESTSLTSQDRSGVHPSFSFSAQGRSACSSAGSGKSLTPQSRGETPSDDPPLLSLSSQHSSDSDNSQFQTQQISEKGVRAPDNQVFIKQLETAKLEVEQKATTLEQQLEEVKRVCASYEKQLEELRGTVTQLETRDAESKEEIAALKRKAAMQSVPDQQSKGNQTTKTVKKLQEEISDLNYNLYYGNTQKDKEIQALRIRLQQTTEGEVHQQEVAKWKTKFQDFQQQAFEDWLMNAGDVSLELY